MRRSALIIAFGSSLALASPAVAQAGPTRSVDDYVCAFTGECDEGQAVAEDESIAAPETKGMSVWRSKPGQKPASTSVAPRRTSPVTARAAPPSSGGGGASVGQPRRRDRVANVSRSTPSTVQRRRVDLRLEFLVNSAELTPQAKEEAKVFARSLLTPQLANKHFRIAGHTDASGSWAYNVGLSHRRAAAVAAFLESLGVPRSRVEVRGYGPDQPLEGRSPTAPEHRRVEAVLL